MKKIVIIGNNTFSKGIVDIIEDQKQYEIYGVLDIHNTGIKRKRGKVFKGLDSLEQIVKIENIYGCVLAIENNFERKKTRTQILDLGYNFDFISIIHSTVIIGKNVFLGIGLIILAGVVINSDSIIGDFCIIKAQSSIGHEGILNNFSSVSFGVISGGNMNLGECSFISFGCNVIENITIGTHTIIGMGSLIINDFPNNIIANGVPAKIVDSRTEDDAYNNIDLIEILL